MVGGTDPSAEGELGGGEAEFDQAELGESEPAVEDVVRAVIGAVAGGFVGTALMTLVLFIVNALFGAQLSVFATISALSGGGDNVLLGFFLFFAAGSVAWPLLFVTIGAYLPGGTRPRQATIFAMLIWVGFVLSFGESYSGLDLAVFLVFSVATHLVYGYVLGLVLARFTGHYYSPELPV